MAFRLGQRAHEQLSRVASAYGASRQNTSLALLIALLYRYTGAPALTVLTRDRGTKKCKDTGLELELTEHTTFSRVLREIHRCASLDDDGQGPQRSVEILVRSDAMRDLSLVFKSRAAELEIRIEYPMGPLPVLHGEDLRDQMHRLLDHYAPTPDASLGAPSLVSDACAERLPNPRAALAAPSFPFVHEAVLGWSERTPNAIAVRSADRDWTYAELADKSRTLARSISVCVESGDTVAVSGMPSFAVVCAMLAVWQRGAVLLTLDPRLPRARRQLMLDQAHARLVVDIGVREDATLAASQTLLVCSESANVLRSPAAAETSRATDHASVEPDAAYVFFTSGSTGTPKAVLGSHRGLAHFLAWQRETFGVRPTDRAAQLTGLSFDVVLRDMFLPLTSGSCLCIPNETDVVDGSVLLPWLIAQRISILHTVPSLALSWLEHAPVGADFSALRRTFFAGEPLTAGFIARFRSIFGSRHQLVNLYGPTETTLAKCYHVVGDEPEANVQPIGRPISHTQALILTPDRQLCGINEPGEIAIRTPFRSLGYLDQPEATARTFVPNPFGGESGDRVYLTGDRGRYRHDGSIDILGRADNQVKLRGVRVELGEIEATLLRSADVAAAAVVVREDAVGRASLVAYVVSRSERESRHLASELREFLGARLPAAFIPQQFIRRTALPLTANGKLDRAALLAQEDPVAAAPHVEPATARERELAKQWAEILQVPSVSTEASFYDLGGDSLTAMRVLVRMRVFGFDEATCQAMLQGKTIAQIANTAPGDLRPATGARLPAHERMRLMLHVLRGLLLISMLSDHYLWRLGRYWLWPREIATSLFELFSFTTPAFAIVFGASLGFIYYPLYLSQRAQAQALLWRNALFVGTAGVVMLLTSSEPFRAWQLQYVAPLFWYYALAFISARFWFRVISVFRSPRVPLLALAATSYAVNELLQARPWTPPLKDGWVLALGKYGYFGMSTGALIGILVGIELRRDMRVRRGWWVIAALLVAYAIARSWLIERGILVQTDGFALGSGAWRWALSAGCVMGLLAILDRWFSRVHAASPAAAGLRYFGLLGQLTFPIFVLHFCTQSIAAVWVSRSVYGVVADGIIVLILACVMLRATTRLLYGVHAQRP